MTGQEPQVIKPTPAPSNDQTVDLDQWDRIVADKYKVPHSLMKAMAGQESGGDVNATSPTGVKGRYQVTQSTAKQYGLDRDDPFQQSVAAAKHLRAQYDSLNHLKNDDERWLGAVGRYYGGNSAVQGDSLSGSSVDGLSNPAEHVKQVAMKWGEARRGEQGAQPSPTPKVYDEGQGPWPAKNAKGKPYKPPTAEQEAMNAEGRANTERDMKYMAKRAKTDPQVESVFQQTGQRQSAQQAKSALDFRNAPSPLEAIGQQNQRIGNLAPLTREEAVTRKIARLQTPEEMRQQRQARDAQELANSPSMQARREAAAQAQQEIAAQKPGAIKRAVLGAGVAPTHALAGIASIPRRLTGAEPGPIETKLGALGDVMAAGSEPTPEQSGTFSAGGLGQLAGVIPTIGAGGRLTRGALPGGVSAPVASGVSGGVPFATMAAGQGGSNAEVVKQGVIGGVVGAASEAGGALAQKAIAQKVASGQMSPAAARIASRGAQGAGGAVAFPAQSALLGERDPEKLAGQALLGFGLGAVHSPGELGAVEPSVIPESRTPSNAADLASRPRPHSVPLVNRANGRVRAPIATEAPTAPVPESPSVAPGQLGMRPRPARPMLPEKYEVGPGARAVMNRANAQTERMPQQAVTPENAPTAEVGNAPSGRYAPINVPSGEIVARPQGGAPADFRQVADNAKIEASQAEQAGNHSAAAAQYDAARQSLTRLRRQSSKNASPEELANLDVEINLANQNKVRAMNAARSSAREQAKAENATTAGLVPNEAQNASNNPQPVQNQRPKLGAETAPLLRPDAENSVDFTRLAEKQGQQESEPGKRIISRIAELGGINMSKHGGEMESARDARRVGLLRKEGVSPDLIAKHLQSEGYNVDPENLNSLWDAINRDVANKNETPLRDVNTADLNARGGGDLGDYYANKPPTEPLAQQSRDVLPSESAPKRDATAPFTPDTADLREVQDFGRKPQTEGFTEVPQESDRPARRVLPFRPPAPEGPRIVGNRPTPTDVNMSAQFPRARRAMLESGKPVQSEIAAGRGSEGPHGRNAQQMFKSTSGKVLHGQDSFFHDPELKGKLGLTRDAEMGEVKNAVTRQLARLLRIKEGEVSLTQIAPEVWRRFADVKALSKTARNKMETAIGRAMGDENATKATGESAGRSEQPAGKASATEAGNQGERATVRSDNPQADFGVKEAANVAENPEANRLVKSGDSVTWTDAKGEQSGKVDVVRSGYATVEKPDGARQVVNAKRLKFSIGALENEPKGPVAASGLGGLQDAFGKKRPAKSVPVEAPEAPKLRELTDAEKARNARLVGAPSIARTETGGTVAAPRVARERVATGDLNPPSLGTRRLREGRVRTATGAVPSSGGNSPPRTPRPGRGGSGGGPKRPSSTATEPVEKKSWTRYPNALLSSAQLTGIPTVTKIVGSHAQMGIAENLSNAVATGIDKIIGAKTGNRTFSLHNPLSDLSEAWKGAKEGLANVKAGKAVTEGTGMKSYPHQFERTGGLAKERIGRLVEDTVDVLHGVPNRAAWQAHYTRAVDSMSKAAARSKTPMTAEDIHARAAIEANQATFRDENFVNKSLKSAKNILNMGQKFGLGDLLGHRYVRIAGSVMTRGMDYSPIGFVKGVVKAASKAADPNVRQREVSLALGRAVVGSVGATAAGALLGNMGILVKGDETKRGATPSGLDKYNLQVNLSALKRWGAYGVMGWASGDGSKDAGKLQSGDTLVTANWAQPWIISAGLGYGIQNQLKGNKKDPDAVKAVMSSLGGMMEGESAIKTWMHIAQAINPEKPDYYGLQQDIASIPSGAVPFSMQLRELEAATDPFKRKTTSKAKGLVRQTAEEAGNKVRAMIPGVAQGLPKSVPNQQKGNVSPFFVPWKVTQYGK